MGRTTGRAIALALSVLCVCAGSALAHALPGSLLMLQRDDAQLYLTVSLPVEDLILAAPGLAGLADLPPDAGIPQAQRDRIGEYLARHLELAAPTAGLPLALDRVTLELGETSHLGRFTLLTARFATPLPADGRLFPLTLTYDAVMHEVRNHRATVYWETPGDLPRGLADFGFQTRGGAPVPVVLPAP